MPSPLRRFASIVLPQGTKTWMRGMRAQLGGYAYQCPVCGERVAQFQPLGEAMPQLMTDLQRSGFDMTLLAQAETLNSDQYLCPQCLAPDRDRLSALFIGEKAPAAVGVQKKKLLDIAPGKALQTYLQGLSAFAYRSADLLRDDVDDQVDVTNMAIYSDGSFDCLVCSHVLEHVPDDRQAMRELYRVLKPGGWGIAMVPIFLSLDQTREDSTVTDPAARTKLFGQDDHVRAYAKRDFIERLQSAGFAVQSLGVEHFGAETFARHGISAKSVLYICVKPA